MSELSKTWITSTHRSGKHNLYALSRGSWSSSIHFLITQSDLWQDNKSPLWKIPLCLNEKGTSPTFPLKGTVYNDFMRCLMFSEERVERDVSISIFAKWFIHSHVLLQMLQCCHNSAVSPDAKHILKMCRDRSWINRQANTLYFWQIILKDAWVSPPSKWPCYSQNTLAC